jgi:hypothetical protein
MLKHTVSRFAALVAAILLVAACGAAPSPVATATKSPGGGAASPSAVPSASASRASSPSPSAAAAVNCEKDPKGFDPKKFDLTGAWLGDDDGIYYLRQVGSVVWWNGMSERAGSPARLGRDFNNVARGEVKDLSIAVEWADVPRGDILGGGTMNLKVGDDGSGHIQIVKVSETGSGFGNTLWTPCVVR